MRLDFFHVRAGAPLWVTIFRMTVTVIAMLTLAMGFPWCQIHAAPGVCAAVQPSIERDI